MKPGKPLSQGAMAEADIERLETLLWERAVPNGGMPLEMLDGYFSALVCSPDLVLPSEYNRLIWGDPPPVWESIDEASESFYLVQGYWNHIVDRIGRDPDAEPDAVTPAIMMPEGLLELIDGIVESGEIPPTLADEDRTFPLASGWAVGFFLGVELREEAWDAWAEAHDHIAEHLDDIQLLMMLPPGAEGDDDGDEDEAGEADALAAEAGDDEDDEDEGEPFAAPELTERLDIMFELPHMLHAFDTLRRSELIRARGPARREAGPGRNDPCPCGSGKKYKKCHGDPAKLH